MPSHAHETYNQESETHSLGVTCSLQLLQFWNFAKFASCNGTGTDEKNMRKTVDPVLLQSHGELNHVEK